MSDSDIGEGDEVRFVDVHHAMNSDLKKLEGETGTVQKLGRKHIADKALVHFDKSVSDKVIERWWIRKSRLEVI